MTSTAPPTNLATERCPVCDIVLTFVVRTERGASVPIDRYICGHCGFEFEYEAASCPKCQLIEVVYIRGFGYGPPTYFCPRCDHTWTVERRRTAK